MNTREPRDSVLRRSAPSPRTSDAEIRRLYEPAPSPELRETAGAAVSEFFLHEAMRRLDAIAEIARELGGAVGEQIRALASPDQIVPTILAGSAVREIVRSELGDEGAALPPGACTRCRDASPGGVFPVPVPMTWIRGVGYWCSRCDGPYAP